MGDKMEYRIGDIAKLLGISSQAIRYYESKGIVNPEKSEENNYRTFSTWDLDILIRTRVLRSYGYSLSEIADLISNPDLFNIQGSFQGQKEKIKRIIEWNQNLLTRIEEENQNIVDTLEYEGKYNIKTRPGMYRLEELKSERSQREKRFKELTKNWMDMAPFVYSSIRIEKEEYIKEGKEFYFGQVIDEKYKEYFNIKENEYISYLPPQKCIYTVIKFNSQKGFSVDLFDDTIRYMKSQGLELKGDIITRISSLNKVDDRFNSYHQAWLPI